METWLQWHIALESMQYGYDAVRTQLPDTNQFEEDAVRTQFPGTNQSGYDAVRTQFQGTNQSGDDAVRTQLQGINQSGDDALRIHHPKTTQPKDNAPRTNQPGTIQYGDNILKSYWHLDPCNNRDGTNSESMQHCTEELLELQPQEDAWIDYRDHRVRTKGYQEGTSKRNSCKWCSIVIVEFICWIL